MTMNARTGHSSPEYLVYKKLTWWYSLVLVASSYSLSDKDACLFVQVGISEYKE